MNFYFNCCLTVKVTDWHRPLEASKKFRASRGFGGRQWSTGAAGLAEDRHHGWHVIAVAPLSQAVQTNRPPKSLMAKKAGLKFPVKFLCILLDVV